MLQNKSAEGRPCLHVLITWPRYRAIISTERGLVLGDCPRLLVANGVLMHHSDGKIASCISVGYGDRTVAHKAARHFYLQSHFAFMFWPIAIALDSSGKSMFLSKKLGKPD
jgi:hypothetical protein